MSSMCALEQASHGHPFSSAYLRKIISKRKKGNIYFSKLRESKGKEMYLRHSK
jgi:hypothetical protein